MADTFTPNYNLTKPEVGGSRDSWGGKENENWDKIDAALGVIAARPVIPPGAVIYFPLFGAPAGYLKANGAAVSRVTYAGLFAVIGAYFGGGDQATTFNLPDLRGEFIRGWDDARGLDASRGLGSVQGQSQPNHNHEIAFGTDGLNSYCQTDGTFQSYYKYANTRSRVNTINEANTYTQTSFSGGLNLTNTNEIRPRNFALLACIKY